jgi:predicted HicB family RNase H-like nuclease
MNKKGMNKMTTKPKTAAAELKMTTVRLPPDLHKAAKHRAINEEINLNELVIKALEKYLEQEPGS